MSKNSKLLIVAIAVVILIIIALVLNMPKEKTITENIEEEKHVEDTFSDKTETIEGAQTTEKTKLTLDDVILLSKKKDLTFNDFDRFDYTEIGSGLYIRHYEIDSLFSLLIGGLNTDGTPMYFYLRANNPNREFIEIRESDVVDFIRESKLNREIYAEVKRYGEGFSTGEDNIKCYDFQKLKFDIFPSNNTLTVYGWQMFEEFEVVDNDLDMTSGQFTQTALTFEKKGDEYSLIEAWYPVDGPEYEEDIRKNFPKEIFEEAIDFGKYGKILEMNCYNQAIQESRIDPYSIIEKYLNAIYSKSPESSSPQIYIDNSPYEHSMLLSYGEYTLRHCFSRFESGEENELNSMIMALICEEILQYKNINIPFSVSDKANAKEWFDSIAEIEVIKKYR